MLLVDSGSATEQPFCFDARLNLVSKDLGAICYLTIKQGLGLGPCDMFLTLVSFTKTRSFLTCRCSAYIFRRRYKRSD